MFPPATYTFPFTAAPMNCPARLALLCAVGLVVIVASRKSGLAEAKPRTMGTHRFVR